MEMLGQLHKDKPISKAAYVYDIRKIGLIIVHSTAEGFIFSEIEHGTWCKFFKFKVLVMIPKVFDIESGKSNQHMEYRPNGQGEHPEPQDGVYLVSQSIRG